MPPHGRAHKQPTRPQRARIHLLNLAWDITGDAFGQRQQQYERYHSGDPVRLAAQQYLNYDKTGLRELVGRALGEGTHRP